MSIRPWVCERCEREGKYLGLHLVAGQEAGATYGVGWGCPSCDAKALDVCPVGPLVPGAGACLNCGAAYPAAGADAACPGCGLTAAAARAFLRVEPAPPDPGAAARDLFGRGLFRRGLALLNEALRQEPGQETPWLLKCTFLEGLGLHGHALRMLEGALAAGGPASLLINYGSALHRGGRHEEAAAASRRYLEREPAGAWAGAARTNLGLALRKLGRDDEAEELYREAIRADAGQVLHYRNLGQLLIDQQRWAGALGVLEAGLARATGAEDRLRFLEGLAFVCAEEDRAEPALHYADQALALGEAGARAHYLRGRALALLGKLDEARAAIDRVLEIDPDHADGKRAREMIEQALERIDD